ncbi:DDB1- and CUL4-associated factor 4 [Spatholobus suberectus]|nr:DDB1- and CUL4-associated factor 4 [Spatholobus suberectus]
MRLSFSYIFLLLQGNVILCGLRNGAILTVDFREKRERLSDRLITHQIPCTSSDKKVGGSNKEWFKLKGDIYPSHTVRMPSSISCLVSLQFDEQYFFSSSMDGSMRLYDRRLLQRGAVQCYEGHVNSHTRIQIVLIQLRDLLCQVERIASYGYGVSSLVNFSLRTSSLTQFSPLCAIKHVEVVLKLKRMTYTSMTLLWVHGLDHMKDCFICSGYECEGSCSYRT